MLLARNQWSTVETNFKPFNMSSKNMSGSEKLQKKSEKRIETIKNEIHC